jgi:anti-repressor protein
VNEIIPIGEGQFPVSARDLYDFLQVRADFTTWIKERIMQYGFQEGADYQVYHQTVENLSCGRPAAVYEITIGMAKELSMVERNERGKQARQYFIECERRYKAIVPQSLPEALRAYADEVERRQALEAENRAMLPKAQFFDVVSDSDKQYTMAEAAQLLNMPGIGRNNLFDLLREKKILKANKEPYQEHVDADHFVLKARPVRFGKEEKPYLQTFVTGKGLQYLQSVLRPVVH